MSKSKVSPLTLAATSTPEFTPDKNEMKLWFDVALIEQKDPAKVAVALDESDFEKFDDFYETMLEIYKFTGFNPSEFRDYLDNHIFVTPKFTSTTKGQTIGMMITLFITRGNKLSAKNEGRMGQKGKDAIQKLVDLFGSELFKKTYTADELKDTTLTPARVAASYPMETVRLIQKFETRIVGNPPKGLPRGFTNSISFSVIPRSCNNLLRAMGLWRDSFSLTINPKARSPYAQFLAKASAYNFSRVALESNFVSEADRIKTVTSVSLSAFLNSTDPMERILILYWVDLPSFLDEAITAEKIPAVTVRPTDKQTLIDFGFRVEVLNSLSNESQSKLLFMVSSLQNSLSESSKKALMAETKPQPVEIQFDLSEILAVGNLGGRDQGASFEVIARQRLKSTNQPGMELPIRQTETPIVQQLPPSFSAPSTSQSIQFPGITVPLSLISK